MSVGLLHERRVWPQEVPHGALEALPRRVVEVDALLGLFGVRLDSSTRKGLVVPRGHSLLWIEPHVQVHGSLRAFKVDILGLRSPTPTVGVIRGAGWTW